MGSPSQQHVGLGRGMALRKDTGENPESAGPSRGPSPALNVPQQECWAGGFIIQERSFPV